MRTALPAALMLCAGVLAGCASVFPEMPLTYTVRPGDTLYRIALRYALDYRELARWNRLQDGDLIFPGQTLRLRPPTGTGTTARAAKPPPEPVAHKAAQPASRRADPPRTAAPPPPVAVADTEWNWPVDGELVTRFGEQAAAGRGIEIAGKKGEPVRAAAAGHVVYSGSGLIGYGKLIIIKHNSSFLSAYGHNNALYVKEGDDVAAGQHIADMGEGPQRRPLLHFEIRQNGEPVDPLLHLPRR